jgi:Holliday junction resolvase
MVKMLEKTTTNKILRFLKYQPECFAFKEHGGMYGQSGIPDILCCLKGKFLAFEVKTSTGKLSKLQEITIEKIRNAQGLAYKVTSLEEVEKIVKEVMLAKNN